jgi:hypothetical protein
VQIEGKEPVALRQPSKGDFEATPLPDRPGVSVLFRPTQARYIFTAIADSTERARFGALAQGYHVDRKGADLGTYDELEVERQARKLALAMAEKLFRGS